MQEENEANSLVLEITLHFSSSDFLISEGRMLIYSPTRKIKVGISKKRYFLDLTVAQNIHKSELLYAILYA